MIGTTHTSRRASEHADALPYRLVGLERFAAWGQAPDAIVPFARGTPGDDTFTGTDANEVFEGGRGNDTLSGGGGYDRLRGGSGDDHVDGGDDNDTLNGGLGDDVVYGGLGDDRIVSDDGNNRLYGDEGDDTIRGTGRLHGGAGDDSMSGFQMSGLQSKLFGGAGNDVIYGINSQMHGGGGDDYLRARYAFDQIGINGAWGDGGADNFVFEEVADARESYLEGGTFVIHDLSNDDRISLSSLDADRVSPGNQTFRLVPEFDGRAGAVTVRYDAGQDSTLIELHADADGIPDGTILTPGNHLDFTNFVL